MEHAVVRRSGATYSALGHLAQQLELSSSKTDDGRESKGEKLHGDGCGISCIRFRERVKASKQAMRMNGKCRAKDVDEGQETNSGDVQVLEIVAVLRCYHLPGAKESRPQKIQPTVRDGH